MSPWSSRSPFEEAETSPLAVEARVDEARRGTPKGAVLLGTAITVAMVGSVVVGVTLRILGLG